MRVSATRLASSAAATLALLGRSAPNRRGGPPVVTDIPSAAALAIGRLARIDPADRVPRRRRLRSSPPARRRRDLRGARAIYPSPLGMNVRDGRSGPAVPRRSERLRRSSPLPRQRPDDPHPRDSAERGRRPSPEARSTRPERRKRVRRDGGGTAAVSKRGIAAAAERADGSTGGGGGGGGDDAPPLLDLGRLVRGTVVRRPSSSVRSPYVADVRLEPGSDAPDPDSDGDDDVGISEPATVLAHAPALDVGGLCSPGSAVYMSVRPPGAGRTSHSVELVTAAGPDGDGEEVLVGAHPRLGEALAREVLRLGLLGDELGFGPAGGGGVEMRTQVTRGDSRVDFELRDPGSGRRALVEVKNVVCADFSPLHAPSRRGPNHCVVVAPSSGDGGADPYRRTALFPWGRVGQEFEGKRVVSARAIKHLRNLADMADGEDGNGTVLPAVIFVVNRSDCYAARACSEACPVFAEELRSAADGGVRVVGFRVRWTEDGRAYFDGSVPVRL